MDHRFLMLAVLGLGCAGGAALACSAPDPGSITFAEKRGGLESSTSSGGSTSSSSSSSSSSTGGTPDAGGSSSGTPADPIFGTTPFAYQNPGVTANNQNAAHAGTVEGKDCVVSGCHGDGGKIWLIGGTVYDAATNGKTIAQAEIKVVDGAGKELAKTYTDPNGNFWFEKGANPAIPAGAKVGVRTATKTKSMATTLAAGQGGCNNANGCHGGTMRIYVN